MLVNTKHYYFWSTMPSESEIKVGMAADIVVALLPKKIRRIMEDNTVLGYRYS